MGERVREVSEPVRVAVVVVSDEVVGSSDASGDAVRSLLTEFGHVVVREGRVCQEQQEVQRVLREAIEGQDVDSIILIGGTGLSKKDVTLEAAEPFQEKLLPGFSELLRQITFEEAGATSLCLRSAAFVSEGKIVFCIPGSEQVARVATGRLIAPELGRLLSECRGHG